MRRHSSDDVGRLLRALPRHEANPAFTNRVMSQLNRAPERVSYYQQGWPVVLAAAAVAAVAVYGWTPEPSARGAELAALRAEYQQLQLELDALAPSPGRLVVPRDSGPDVYIHLRPLAASMGPAGEFLGGGASGLRGSRLAPMETQP